MGKDRVVARMSKKKRHRQPGLAGKDPQRRIGATTKTNTCNSRSNGTGEMCTHRVDFWVVVRAVQEGLKGPAYTAVSPLNVPDGMIADAVVAPKDGRHLATNVMSPTEVTRAEEVSSLKIRR